MTRILDVLLDLTLFPACCRVTELGLEQIMTDHGEEAGVDGSGLAAPDLVHGGAHIVVNPPARHAAQHAERMIMSVEQHLMGLKKIGPHGEGPAVAELKCATCSLVRTPSRIAQSSLQSNWKASPGANDNGTKVPRPLICCCRRYSSRHARAKAGTRP